MDTAHEVERFIETRFKQNCDWTKGNCLWFAYILCMRFKHMKVYYLPSSGHFVAGLLGEFFDWTGKIIPDETPILFDDIKDCDEAWYSRLLSDCYM